MPPFPEWLSRVLSGGESVQDAPPALAASEYAEVERLLREAFDVLALDVPGPPIPFDAEAAVAAAGVLAVACWRLVGDESFGPRLGEIPRSPAAHLSADVCLRFLPAVYRRARFRDPESALTRDLAELLRGWPLSGVLADLEEPPPTPTDFHGHAGLQVLFAERLFAVGRPSWVPESGPPREWAERVFLERNKPLPAPPPKEEPRA